MILVIIILVLILYFQVRLKIFITTKLNQMSLQLDELKAALVAANEKVAKVAADVTRLHEKIDAAGDVPTAEEWAEVKTLAEDLNTSLQAVDEKTPEE